MSWLSALDPGTGRALRGAGITTEAAAFEALTSQTGALLAEGERLAVLQLLRQSLSPHEVVQLQSRRTPVLSLGVAGRPSPDGKAATRRRSIWTDSAMQRTERLLRRIAGTLPREFHLKDYQSLVRQQGARGTCVAQAVAGGAEFFHRLPRSHGGRRQARGPGSLVLSAEHIYRLAKERDGHTGEGTWQEFAWQALMEVGCVSEARLPYGTTDRSIRLASLERPARRHRIAGYVDLLVPRPFAEWQVPLLMAVVSGRFPGMGPQPVGASVAVTEAFGYRVAELTGRILLLPGAPILGGHAMLIVGYFWDAALGQTVFVLRNSWGLKWAAKSPVHPGCALIPEAYFKSDLTWELFTPLSGPSPASGIGWLGALLRWGWDSRTLALS